MGFPSRGNKTRHIPHPTGVMGVLGVETDPCQVITRNV